MEFSSDGRQPEVDFFLYSWAVQWFCPNPRANRLYKTTDIEQYK